MRSVIEFDGSQHARILGADYKIVAQAIDSVVPRVEVEALLDAENTRYLHLGQNDVLWEAGNQTVIEHLFRLRKWALCVEGPWTICRTEQAAPLEDNEREDRECEEQQNKQEKLQWAHLECWKQPNV